MLNLMIKLYQANLQINDGKDKEKKVGLAGLQHNTYLHDSSKLSN